MYSYIGDVSLLCGVEDIDNTTLDERPKMFDSVARPYVLAFGDTFSTLPSCGVGGPNAQAAEAEKILSCNPDIVISEYEDVDKENALQEQLGVPVITLKAGPNGVFDDAFKNTMTMLGTIFCNEEKAEKLVSFIDSEAAEIASRTADIKDEDKPGVYICGLGNWGTTNHLMTAQNYISFNIANVRNVEGNVVLRGHEVVGRSPVAQPADVYSGLILILYISGAGSNFGGFGINEADKLFGLLFIAEDGAEHCHCVFECVVKHAVGSGLERDHRHAELLL